MLVSIVGSHGIPARYGGFETFAEQLALACAAAGLRVRVVNEKNNPVQSFHPNIEILSSDYNKGEETLKFYQNSLQLAKESDIILVCGVGGSYYYKELENSPVKIITNVDGMEHLRGKYTLIQRVAIYFLQRLAAKRSNYIVADSHVVGKYWRNRFPHYSRKIKVISYGADKSLPFNESLLSKFKIEKSGYFLVIARLVPENNIHEIIHAYKKYIGLKKLVITGPLDDNSYIRDLRKSSNEKVIFTDAIYDKEVLDTLRQGCFVYVHGHSVGGTNPSLLEAMAANCACVCHDNVYNRETTANSQIYFNSYSDLSIILNLMEHKHDDLSELRKRAFEKVTRDYSWNNITASYISLFEKVLNVSDRAASSR